MSDVVRLTTIKGVQEDEVRVDTWSSSLGEIGLS